MNDRFHRCADKPALEKCCSPPYTQAFVGDRVSMPVVMSPENHLSDVDAKRIAPAVRELTPLLICVAGGLICYGLFYNRGLGLSNLPLRFGARPEVALLVLTNGSALPPGVRRQRRESRMRTIPQD